MRNDLSSKLTKVAFLTLLLGCMCPVTSRAQPVASPTTPDVTALCDAIQERRWPEALRIVEAGVAVTNTDQKGRSALAVLTQSWFGSTGDDKLRQQLLRELLDGGADPFASGYSGFYPRGDLAVVEEALQKVDSFLSDLLLTNRPSPARRTPRGDTALHLAAQSARNNMIAFLLSAGFSVNQTNSDGVTPLQCVASLAAKGTFILTNDSPPLFLRWQFKGDGIVPWFPSVAELLLSRGAILDACSAAGMGMTNQLAGLLRANPASLNMQDGLGRTPLHYAALAYQTNTAALLIQAGADTSFLTTKPIARTRDRDAITAGSSPLHLACLRESREIVQMLLKAGAPVDQKDADGNTPLHLAAHWGATNCPWLLITAHAPLDATNNAGKTPLRVAVERRSVSNVELLLKVGARADVGLNGETLLHVTAAHIDPIPFFDMQDGRSIPVLLRHGLAVDARDEKGRTPLQRAVTVLNLKTMNVFLTNGANVNAADIQGNTALHQLAIQTKDDFHMELPMDPSERERLSHLGQQIFYITSTNISVTGWLLDHGANPNLTNHAGLTPLELVCGQHWGYWDKKMATNRITLLLKAGAKVSKPGFDSLEACLEKIK